MKGKPGARNERQVLTVVVLGAGEALARLLSLAEERQSAGIRIRVAGVCADDEEDPAVRAARESGAVTAADMKELFVLDRIDALVNVTGDPALSAAFLKHGPPGVSLLDLRLIEAVTGGPGRRGTEPADNDRVQVQKMISDFLIRNTAERIVVLKPDFTIGDASPAYLEATGKRLEQVIGAHCYEMTHGLGSPCATFNPELGCPVIETLKTGESAHVFHEHPVSTSEATYCDLVTYPIKDRNGNVREIIEIWRDITEAVSQRAEKQLESLKSDLGRILQEDRLISLGKLAASCAHEINNPIQGLLMFCGLMRDTFEQGRPDREELEKFKGYLALMSDELERCGRIATGLLSFSRSPVAEQRGVDLNDALESVLTLTRHKMELQNIVLSKDLSGRPPIVMGDLSKLQQCFLNLVFNAIEAMPAGGELRVVSRLDKRRKVAKVEIQDTGFGIPQENLDAIFDPFFTTKSEGKGTGLGLSIVYGVIKSHSGNIEVQSEEGKGSTFMLTFPL